MEDEQKWNARRGTTAEDRIRDWAWDGKPPQPRMARYWGLFKDGVRESIVLIPSPPPDMRPATVAGRWFARLVMVGLLAALAAALA